MQVLAGGILGYVASVGAWLLAQRFVAHSGCEGDTEGAAREQSTTSTWRSLASLPAILTQGGLVSWGAYAGWRAPWLSMLVPAVVFTTLLVTISLVDLQTRRIPNTLVATLLLWAAVQVAWLGEPSPLCALVGLLVAASIFILVALVGRGAMGWGDVKLEAALGGTLGFPLILSGLLAGALAGGVAALVMLATGRVGRKDTMAYGPYLAIGAWFVWTQSVGLLW